MSEHSNNRIFPKNLKCYSTIVLAVIVILISQDRFDTKYVNVQPTLEKCFYLHSVPIKLHRGY